MLSMYRFMNRDKLIGEMELVVRFRDLDFPDAGPAQATEAQREALTAAVCEAAAQEARYGQIVLARHSGSGAIVAVENLAKRGHADALTWVV
jgi:nucleotide-binding universal stress UspA family protein